MLQPNRATTIFMSQQTKKTFSIFFNVNCKSEYVIQVVKCILCEIQYLEEATTTFNLRLNNHRKDTDKFDSILPYYIQYILYFQYSMLYFQQ